MGFWSKLFGSKRAKKASGYSPEDPLICKGPTAEREIIERLRCPNGHRLRFRRLKEVSSILPRWRDNPSRGSGCFCRRPG